ncbi:MAG: phosphoglycolate phosphatase [Candidatus Endobugula sp.]|jgi:phosphoglycolate phosphatase
MLPKVLLIFDWDGTLSDSTSKIVTCLQEAAKTADFPVLADDVICNIIGLGLPEAMERLYPDLNDDQKDQVRRHYVEHFLAADQIPSPFFVGVEEGLATLRDSGFKMAVATGKSRRGLDRVLDRLNMRSYFDASRCADETRSKPHPLMLEELLLEMDVDADKAVMVGDTEYDMEMAENARVHRIAVSYGAHHLDRLKPYRPVLCADHFSECVEWALSHRK